MTIDLITLEEGKMMLNTDVAVTKKDALIQLLISQSSSVIEKFCRREFDKKERVEYFDTQDTRKVYLDLTGNSENGYGVSAAGQVFSLKSMSIDLSQPFEVSYSPYNTFNTDAVVSPDWYILDADAGTLTLKYGTINAYKALQVKYTGGYEITPATGGEAANLSANAPADLKLACSILVAFMYDKQKSASFGVHQQYGESGRMYANKGILPPECMELLMSYRRHFVRTV